MQKSIIIGLLVALLATGLAALVGAFAGYFGGWVDKALMWGVDLLLVLPSFLIIAIVSPRLKGASWLWFVALLAAFTWMITSRVVRSMTLSLREREYVLAAVYMGIPRWKIILRHIVPNLSSLLIIDATLNVSAAIIGEAALSFFGFGIQPPDVSLGTLIAEGPATPPATPGCSSSPPACWWSCVLERQPLGDGLRDALDPAARNCDEHALGGPRPRRRPSPAASQAVRGVSYEVARGEVLGIVGESGSGKSVTSLAIMGLLPPDAVVSGSVQLHGQELLGLDERRADHGPRQVRSR